MKEKRGKKMIIIIIKKKSLEIQRVFFFFTHLAYLKNLYEMILIAQ
jgi:hypothetical protein